MLIICKKKTEKLQKELLIQKTDIDILKMSGINMNEILVLL